MAWHDVPRDFFKRMGNEPHAPKPGFFTPHTRLSKPFLEMGFDRAMNVASIAGLAALPGAAVYAGYRAGVVDPTAATQLGSVAGTVAGIGLGAVLTGLFLRSPIGKPIGKFLGGAIKRVGASMGAGLGGGALRAGRGIADVLSPLGMRGPFGAAAGMVGGTAKMATEAAKDTERFFLRPLLTGRGPYADRLDAWFPNFRNRHHFDPTRYAPNPTIARRVMVAGLAFGAASTVHEGLKAMNAPTPPPQVYFDGTHMRHVNDQGAGGGWGEQVLAPNSILSTQHAVRRNMLMGSGY